MGRNLQIHYQAYARTALSALSTCLGKRLSQGSPYRTSLYRISRAEKSSPKELSSVFADIALRIAGTDIYHIECQMEKEDTISIRMVEYDTHIAILYGSESGYRNGTYSLRYPNSIILYLGNNQTVPDKSVCHIHFPDGTETLYAIPIIKVQNYTLQDIREYHLSIFLPFVLLRFRPRLKSKKNKLTEKELTIFVNEIMIMLDDELQGKYITQRQYKDYINYIRMAAGQIFAHHPKFHKEVSNMFIPTVFSYSEVEDKITAKVTRKVTAEITAQFQNILQQKEAEIAAIRAALESKGIDIDELLSQNS